MREQIQASNHLGEHDSGLPVVPMNEPKLAFSFQFFLHVQIILVLYETKILDHQDTCVVVSSCIITSHVIHRVA